MNKLQNYMNYGSLKDFQKLLLHGLRSLRSKMDNTKTGLKVKVGEQHVDSQSDWKKMKVEEGMQNFELQTKVENKGASLVAQLTYKEIYSNCSMVNNPICHDLNWFVGKTTKWVKNIVGML